MKITAYPLYHHVPSLQPAAAMTNGTSDASHAYIYPQTMQRQGWQLLCPVSFSATWNGGPDPADIEIRFETNVADTEEVADVSFVQSQMGAGLLTFYSGYQLKTAEAHQLWVRGPINAPKDGIAPLESLVDASMIPGTAVIHWQFTRPNQTVHFAAGEPFGHILLHANSARENIILTVEPFAKDANAYEQAFQQMADSISVQRFFHRMKGNGPKSSGSGNNRVTPAPSPWALQLNNPPPVSCICPTYGRVELLEEAIESFLRQDYPGPKELIVLNDYAGQTLLFDHPEVQVINFPDRFRSVGEKYKAAASLASHDILFVWHDDDIYLPHRLSYSVAHMDAETSFFKANSAWTWNHGALTGAGENLFHGGSCWTRTLFSQVQGYPHIDSGYDMAFEQLCQAIAPGSMRTKTVQPADLYYLHRWNGTGSYHFSVLGGNGHGSQPVVAYVADQANRGEIREGDILLEPRWLSDYSELAQQAVADLPAESAEPADEEMPFPPPYHEIAPPPPLSVEGAAQLFRGDYPCKISVILPASNESVLLQRTVEQFAATLPEECEIIVIDNGSTDGCSDFLLENCPENIHLIRTPDPLGVAGARNRGLAQAQGEIIVFADAHIDIPQRWWEPLIQTVNRPGVGIVGPGIGVMGKPRLTAACGQRIAEAKLRVEWLSKEGEDPYPVPTLGGGFMVMRHDTLKAAGAFDEGMPQWGSEDLEICLRYWMLGYEVWVVPSVTVLHYFRQTSPYKVEWRSVAHNLLRVALLHLSGDRLTRVLAALKGTHNFEDALSHAVTSDVWQKRLEFATRRMHNDDWLFEKFADSCPV